VVDRFVEKHGTRATTEAYLQYLYSDEGQEIAAKHHYRPRSATIAAKYASDFPTIKLFTVDEVFGGWANAQKAHFADGGIFDRVVRTVEPVLADLPADIEEASAVLGASRWYTFRRVLLPSILPALLTGFTLSFARAVGEYGSIVFISGNMPMRTEITPLLIVTKLEQYDYAGASALAVVMLSFSFVLLLLVNLLQRWARTRLGFEG
jgi:ABC-type sulfate transport system permease subunit